MSTSALASVFRTVGNINTNPTNPSTPMLNVISNSLNSYMNATNQLRKKKHLMGWYKGIPELTGLVNKVVKDMISKWHFESVNPKESGKNKIMNANKFATQVRIDHVRQEQATDAIVTGEGYGWIGKISKKQVKEVIDMAVNGDIFIREKKEVSNILEKKFLGDFDNLSDIDEDLTVMRKYRAVASSTVEIIYDQFKIKSYIQTVGTNQTKEFTPEEIIRYSLMQVDGKVSGFTPIESIVVQLELLRQMWQNMLSIYNNGGAPDKVFIFKNMRMSDPNFKRVREQLEKYKLVENKHGNMVFTGDVSIEDLQQLDKMQFQDMGLYITGLMAMQWGIPRSSIPFIQKDANVKDDSGGNSEKGYWMNIEWVQKLWAEIENTQLWIPYFGVKIVFDSPFIQQDVQYQTARQLKLNNLQLEESLLSKTGLKLTPQTWKRELERNDMEVIEMTPEEVAQRDMMQNPQSTLDKQLSKDDQKPIEDRNVAKRKKDEQTLRVQSTGVIPNGVSKEIKFNKWSDKAEQEFKEMVGSDSEKIDIKTFIKIYNQDKIYNPGMPPRVFFRENTDFVSMKFKSSDFIYQVILTQEEFLNNKIILQNVLVENVYEL